MGVVEVEVAVEGLTGWGASRVRLRDSALRSMDGHRSTEYSSDGEELSPPMMIYLNLLGVAVPRAVRQGRPLEL